MADKKKGQEVPDTAKFSPEEYLDRHCVTTYLKDVLTLMLENRPEDPIDFIADYFQNVITGTSPLVRSYRYVKLTPRSRAAFVDNLVAAYQSMHQTGTGHLAVEKEEDGQQPNYRDIGICVQELKQLMQLVCADFPEPLLQVVEAMLKKPNGALVSFEEFAITMNICLLFDDFLMLVQQLFHLLDGDHTGKVSSIELIQHLQQLLTRDESHAMKEYITALNKSPAKLSLQELLIVFVEQTKI